MCQCLGLLLFFGIAHLQRFQRTAGILHRGICRSIGIAHRFVFGISVQHRKMVFAFQQLQIVALTVDADEGRRHGAQRVGADSATVYLTLRAPIRAKRAGEQQIAILVRRKLVFGKQAAAVFTEITEHGADHGFFLAGAQKFPVAARAEQKADAVNQNRLARAGLTCQCGKALFKINIHAFDNCDIFDVQRQQHGHTP